MSGLSIAFYFPFTRVKVVAQNVHAEGALIQVHPDLRWHPLCHDCRAPACDWLGRGTDLGRAGLWRVQKEYHPDIPPPVRG